MKHRVLLGFISFLTCLCFGPTVASGQGTSFSYQGRLADAGAAATGPFDFEFRLFNAESAGAQIGSTIASSDIAVSNGLFTVQLDFGSSSFSGAARWLEISVRNGTNVGAFNAITPRQPITPAPYAIFAGSAGTVTNGAIGNAQLQNNSVDAANIASGQVVKSLNGLRDDVTLSAGANITLTPSGNNIQITSGTGNDWRLSGNTAAPGDFLGTLNNVPLDLKANDARILRLEPTATSPNLIGGFSGNSVLAGQSGSLVASGGRAGEPNVVRESYSVIVGGYANTNTSILGFIGNGAEHKASGAYSVIAGGFRSVADGGAIVGGVENFAGASAFVGGGGGNAATLAYSVVNGGLRNKSFAAPYSVIGGGYENSIPTTGDYSIIAGGKNNTNRSPFSVIGGGGTNSIASGSTFGTVAGGELNGIENSASHAVVGGGRRNAASATYATVAGGSNNVATLPARAASIGGGESNRAHSAHTVIGGGERNDANGFYAVIAGGARNTTGEQGASIGGGSNNRALGHHSRIGGGSANEASEAGSTIGGGSVNIVNGFRGTVAGGERNWILTGATNAFIGGGRGNLVEDGANFSTVGGGATNTASGRTTVVAGGVNNTATAESSAVGGGSNNDATGSWNTIGGGAGNTSSASHSTVAGGWVNEASNHKAAVGGGSFNVASGFHATVPGGANNQAQGDYSFAAGRAAIAGHDGSFVWADDLGTPFSSTTNRQVAVRANNGVMIQSTNRALDLRGGGSVRVAGAGLGTSTPAFIHRATAGNVGGNGTVIDHPHSNNDPNAILIVTQNWNPGGVGGTYNNHPIGVYYSGGRWLIFNQDLAAMPVNAAFNVLIIKP